MNKLKLSMSVLVSLLCCASLSAAESDVIASVEYFYAQDGTLIGRAINGIRKNFEYEKRGQLLSVKDAAGRDLERYTYDPAGNRLSKTVNGVTTTYTYDEANQLKTSTVNGETTHYRYDAAGRLVQAGDKTYYYFGANDKVTEVRQGDKVIAEFDYFIDGQIARAKYPDREESFTWDGLALVQRNEVSYLNEPYVTGGNPILSSRDGVMFNDMLGSTLNIGRQPVSMTSFGESADDSAFFTGKPMISELGYAFLFRDYNPSQGKWTSSDPLGYPDGWNNLAYCNNGVIENVDYLGAWTTNGHKSFFEGIKITVNISNVNYILNQESISRIEFFDIMTDADSSLTKPLVYNTEHIDFARTQHYHAMCSPGEDVVLAGEAIDALIELNFTKARSASSLDEALYYVGLASHTFQDKMAPQHFNEGPLVWYPEDFASIENLWNHKGELFVSPSQENKKLYESRLTSEMKELVKEKPAWLNQLFIKE